VLSLLRRGKNDAEIVAHYTVVEHGLNEQQVAALRASVAAAPPAPPLLSSTPSKTPSKPAFSDSSSDAQGRKEEEVGIGLTLTNMAPYDVLKLAPGGAAHISGQVKPKAQPPQSLIRNLPSPIFEAMVLSSLAC
jgi:hypothetical protein